MRLTFEEFRKLPMQYTFGYSAETHAVRQYQNFEHRICKQVYTPRDKRTGEWGKGEAAYMMTDTTEEFETPRALYERKYLTPWFTYEHGTNKDWLPTRPGWYETKWRHTKTGMHWWSGDCWYTDETMKRLVAVTAWRGMRDIELK